jgi:hypothetical protein
VWSTVTARARRATCFDSAPGARAAKRPEATRALAKAQTHEWATCSIMEERLNALSMASTS